MKRCIRILLAVGLLAATPWYGAAQRPGQLNKIMLEKLNSSKTVLEGIALADFTKISSHADKLIQLSKTSEWFVLKTPRFETHTNEFRRAAENIVSKSREKNLDGVTLAYFDLTMACVRCHQYVRDVREARAPAAPGAVAAE
jgi:cytochrome c556